MLGGALFDCFFLGGGGQGLYSGRQRFGLQEVGGCKVVVL